MLADDGCAHAGMVAAGAGDVEGADGVVGPDNITHARLERGEERLVHPLVSQVRSKPIGKDAWIELHRPKAPDRH